MYKKARPLASLLLGYVAIGCGGGGQKPSDAMTEAPTHDAASPDATIDHSDAIAEVLPLPLPVASPGSHLLVAGAAVLVGSGPDSCSNQLPPTGDRWCAFARPSSTLGFSALWVINATKAAQGVAIKCDTTDANCLRLTSNLFDDATNGFTGNGFNGGTLIYMETNVGGVSPSAFQGVISAWRPGWAGGRVLTSQTGVFCAGQQSSDSALCFDNPQGDGMTTPLTFDLHAGTVADLGSSPLPMVDTVLVAAATDAAGASPRFQYNLSPDGAYVLWSTRSTATAPEILKAQRVGSSTGTQLTVAQDVSRWSISPDGLSWYWLKGFNYDITGAPSGTLQAAAFPSGSGATTLAAVVGDYSVIGNTGISFRSNVAQNVGTLKWQANRGAAPITVDQSVLTVFDLSKDGASAAYAKHSTTIGAGTSSQIDLFDLYIGSSTGATPCTLAATPSVFSAAIFSSGSTVSWERFNRLTGAVGGFGTSVAGCATQQFATRLRNLLPVDNQGYIYLDDPNPTADEATLRLIQTPNGVVPTSGTQIQTRAASIFAPLLPSLSAVMYTVGTNTSADGLYINAALPFVTTPTVPATDGGPPRTTDGGAADQSVETAPPDAIASDAGADGG